jgi:SNF2 family DNA or RNA helicase
VIRISAGKAGLSLVADEQDPILRGTHRAYFETILNFRRRPSGEGFDWTEPGRITDQLRDVCDYIEDNGLPYVLDESAQRLLERARGSETRLAAAIASGRELLQRRMSEPRVPGFKRRLLRHQWKPVEHLTEIPNVASFSVPGSGKTMMVLAAFQKLKAADEIDCLLVIGPGSSFLAWEEEYEACLKHPQAVVRLSGPPEERATAYLQAARADLVLVTYHTANNDENLLIDFLRSRRCLLVLDESHYVKGTGALARMALTLAPEATRRIVLTGTPMPNGFLDLWSQATFLWPEQHLLGNRLQFKALVAAPQGQLTAKNKIRPLFTRVTKSDLNLPRQQFERVTVTMGEIQKRIYDALAAKTLHDLNLLPAERMLIREWRKAKMVRLLQAASNPALLGQMSIEFSVPPESSLDRPLLQLVEKYLRYEMPNKVLAADKLVRRILKDPKEKVVVWTHFIRNIELLLELLKDFGALPLYGAIPRDGPDEEENTRENHIKAFRHDPGTRVLIANPGAAAESISLHKVCHHAIYVDRTFNAGQFIQSRDRIHRVGLKRSETVTYHLLLSNNSIDQIVDQRLQQKEQAMLDALEDPDVPTIGVEIATDHLSGPDESEERIDFDAVIEDIRKRLRSRV